MRFTNRVSCRLALLGLALAVAAPGAAAGFVSQAYPLPQRVDRERVATSLLLQFDIERYGQPFETFAARRPLDPFEAAFARFVQGLVAGDLAKVAALRPGEERAQTRALVEGYRSFFEGGGAHVGVAARVAVGDHQVFVWDWPTPGGRVLQAFAVEGRADKPRVEIVTSNRPVDTLVVDALQNAARQPDVYAPVTPDKRYRFALPVAGGGPGAHPAVLHFDGAPVDVELFESANGAAAGAPAPPAAAPPAGRVADVLRAYVAAWDAFESRDLERFVGAYTEKSREKLRGWFAEMSPERFDAYHAHTTGGRRVRFVLDADPLAIVFYSRGPEKRLYYDYLVAGGRRGYQLTNAYFEDFLDDVLGNDALFATDVESFRQDVLGLTSPE